MADMAGSVSAGGDTNDATWLFCPGNVQQAHLRYRLSETRIVEHVFVFSTRQGGLFAIILQNVRGAFAIIFIERAGGV